MLVESGVTFSFDTGRIVKKSNEKRIHVKYATQIENYDTERFYKIQICVSAINECSFVNEMKNSLTTMNAIINLLDEMYSEWKNY